MFFSGEIESLIDSVVESELLYVVLRFHSSFNVLRGMMRPATRLVSEV